MGALRRALLLALALAAPLAAADTTAPVFGGLLRPTGTLRVRAGAELPLLLRWSVAEPDSFTVTASVTLRRPDGGTVLVGTVLTSDPAAAAGSWLLDAGPALTETAQAGAYAATAVACNNSGYCSTATAQVLVQLLDDPERDWDLAPQPLRCPGAWLRFGAGRYAAVSARLYTRRGAQLGQWRADTASLNLGRLWIGCDGLPAGAYLLRVELDDGAGPRPSRHPLVVQP